MFFLSNVYLTPLVPEGEGALRARIFISFVRLFRVIYLTASRIPPGQALAEVLVAHGRQVASCRR